MDGPVWGDCECDESRLVATDGDTAGSYSAPPDASGFRVCARPRAA